MTCLELANTAQLLSTLRSTHLSDFLALFSLKLLTTSSSQSLDRLRLGVGKALSGKLGET
jgi:hypothetical protein